MENKPRKDALIRYVILLILQAMVIALVLLAMARGISTWLFQFFGDKPTAEETRKETSET